MNNVYVTRSLDDLTMMINMIIMVIMMTIMMMMISERTNHGTIRNTILSLGSR